MRPRCAAVALAACAATAQAQDVTFPSLDGTAVPARIFRPDVPRGTVVALHGCAGLFASRGKRTGQLTARHIAMAQMLVQEGYAVVFPDSLTPRRQAEVCTQRYAARRVGPAQRRADALGALAWVARQPWATPGRIALLGWSQGGSAVLAATDAGHPDVASVLVKPAVAVAFYPGCSQALREDYTPTTHLVLLLAEHDDWTPAAPCIKLGRQVRADVQVYPGAYHGFDSPVGEVRLRPEIPNGAKPGQGVHSGPDPVAREQAYAKVRELLRTAFR